MAWSDPHHTPLPDTPRTRVVRLKRVRLRLLIAAAVTVGLALWLANAGALLIYEQPPEAADAIVVLAGNAADRLPHGLALKSQGFASLVVISNERVHTHGLETTWLALHRAGLSAPELDDADLAVLDDPPPESTIDEAHRVADVLAVRGLHSALLVTDAFHSRRAYLLFRAAFAHKGLTVRSTPAADTFGLAQWWAHPLAARRVAEEWAKLALYLVEGAYW
ncbi:MAG TPA: YdcF family protein [Chloroflexota bacterium]|nr:YdcF family protein [Chloroflexota bacterium]